jgi:hypothetical protein
LGDVADLRRGPVRVEGDLGIEAAGSWSTSNRASGGRLSHQGRLTSNADVDGHRLRTLRGELRLRHLATYQHYLRVEVDLDQPRELQTDILTLGIVEPIGDGVLRVRPRQGLANRLGEHLRIAQL